MEYETEEDKPKKKTNLSDVPGFELVIRGAKHLDPY